LCNRRSGMRAPKRQILAALAWISCLVAIAGCASAPTPKPRPVQDDPTAARTASPEEELTMIRADSELFAAVVRAQLAGGDDDYPNHLEPLRYDPRPYGTPSGYPEVFAGVQGIDPTLTFARAGESAIDQLIENRKQILKMSDVPAGRPVSYPQCAGAGVPQPPPPRGSRSATRSKRADVHAGCPKTAEYYLTVGLPIRGQPEGLKNNRDTQGRRVALRGDVWTALVDQYSAGPKGWRRSQYAWLFRRARGNGPLELSATILIAVVE
jgi:hypothetical protein